MPALSPTMTEGTIVKWHKKEGDTVSPGDILCDIQTDKAVVTMDTEEEGILAKIIMPENSKDIKIGTLIALMVEEGDDWKNVEVPDTTSTPSTTAAQPESSQQQTGGDIATTVEGGRIRMSPSARKLLEEYNIQNPQQVAATGPHGMINKGDVLKFVSSKNLTKVDLSVQPTSTKTPASPAVSTAPPPVSAPPQAAGTSYHTEEVEYDDISTSSMRKTIAKRLTESKTTIPHAYVSIDCNMGTVSNLRKEIVASGIKCSINDFIIKAAGLSLQMVPKVNSLFHGDKLELTSAVDISVAVATDQGLITPIVKSAATLGVDQISSTVKVLATKAREGKLQLHEFQGGSFTISNLGMFGISEFSAVINPPQTAILAVGGSRLVVSEDGKPQTNMTVTLSYDTRALDETEASHFLEMFKNIMENPSMMTVGLSKSEKQETMFM
ncbi:hypothetical protein FSP39_022783 [Pinctada imbricata]|uniref:Dihydrolipoamide acetyltransferase component of pyruvate dehydrogenase complex n=1 Tax=Pinctada imbricata TaxID=66713 RepID=A0AA88YFH0_PINIB|nr:hypothetical protein FSP39_022783 [Pinctada imbricata]